jgi:DNA-binding response OmpR family regulator
MARLLLTNTWRPAPRCCRRWTPGPPRPHPARRGGRARQRPDGRRVLVDARRELAHAKSLCRVLRATGTSAPVIADPHRGRARGLTAEWGVDDVLLDTAGPAEVEARLRLAVRPGRDRRGEDEDGPIRPAPDDRRGELLRAFGGRTLDLTYKEFELLKYLAQHPGRVFTRAQLLQEVWGYDYFGGTRTVDVHVRRLRAKLGPEHELLIGTVRNVGYRFVPSVPPNAEVRAGLSPDVHDGIGYAVAPPRRPSPPHPWPSAPKRLSAMRRGSPSPRPHDGVPTAVRGLPAAPGQPTPGAGHLLCMPGASSGTPAAYGADDRRTARPSSSSTPSPPRRHRGGPARRPSPHGCARAVWAHGDLPPPRLRRRPDGLRSECATAAHARADADRRELPPAELPDGFRSCDPSGPERRGRPGSRQRRGLRLPPRAGAGDRRRPRPRMEQPWFDPAGLLMLSPPARRGPGVAGFHWTKVDHDGPRGHRDPPRPPARSMPSPLHPASRAAAGRPDDPAGLRISPRDAGSATSSSMSTATTSAARRTYRSLGFRPIWNETMFTPRLRVRERRSP